MYSELDLTVYLTRCIVVSNKLDTDSREQTMTIIEVWKNENVDPSVHTRQDALDMAVTESEMEAAFDEHLNADFPEVNICGRWFEPANAFKRAAGIDYRIAMSEWRAENFDEVDTDDYPETLDSDEQDVTCPRCEFCPQCDTVTHTRIDGKCSTCLFSPPVAPGYGW